MTREFFFINQNQHSNTSRQKKNEPRLVYSVIIYYSAKLTNNIAKNRLPGDISNPERLQIIISVLSIKSSIFQPRG